MDPQHHRVGAAGAIGSPFWNTVRKEHLVSEGSLREIWSSLAYNGCMFTARPDRHPERVCLFAEALSPMSYDNPVHRPMLDAEGLEHWLPSHAYGYAALPQAAAQQGFFKPLFAQTPASPWTPSRLRKASLTTLICITWHAQLIPVKKAIVIFSAADEPFSKGQLQIALTATPLN